MKTEESKEKQSLCNFEGHNGTNKIAIKIDSNSFDICAFIIALKLAKEHQVEISGMFIRDCEQQLFCKLLQTIKTIISDFICDKNMKIYLMSSDEDHQSSDSFLCYKVLESKAAFKNFDKNKNKQLHNIFAVAYMIQLFKIQHSNSKDEVKPDKPLEEKYIFLASQKKQSVEIAKQNEEVYQLIQKQLNIIQEQLEQKTESIISLQTYLKALGIPEFIKLKANFETLCLIVNKHVLHIGYQNLHLHLKARIALSFEFKDLVQRMIVNREGGICYEHCQITYYVLKALGFDTQQILCQTLKRSEAKFDPSVYFVHAAQIVNIKGKLYLVETGFGGYSPRYPLPFDPKKNYQYYEFSEIDKYQIFNNQDHIEVQYFENDQWKRAYGFEWPPIYKTPQDIQE
ncbi:inosine-uridine nucleoside n-ribohydrolase [Stylonychia lemnae]|uniref:Inosine-uridine nucleoside n-ribohydrolase n=1 Tax=Stylonychia lemnae TaxID=5949 RepID=A0A078A4V3_STYLE|nr:inosine-uridine nucleoside n-ribohydrolase [Stylonychia lemnae]|eukprot:CDW75804.1 inosine-uridine nucleoside n-ribohydrolase [Stylonychia lemnae]